MMRRWKHVWYVGIVTLLLLAGVGCAPSEEPMTEESAEEPMADDMEDMGTDALVATATLQGRSDSDYSGITGSVTFTQDGEIVRIVADLEGAPPGPHGFHIHEIGDCSAADFTSTGGHFNPGGVDHAGPDAAVRHAGDLGNVEIGEDGSGSLELTSDLVTVGEGDHSVVGRGVILHEGEDDLSTQPTGAAGGRIACGVIEKQM